jgi:hypothetical protein
VERGFGTETVAHIRDMTRYRLERDLLTGRLEVPSVLLPRVEAQVRGVTNSVPLGAMEA